MTKPSATNEGCHFHVEILAPHGLIGVEPYLAQSKMKLTSRTTQYNGQVILRARADEGRLDFNMDPSTTDTMHASGDIFLPAEEAWSLLESFSCVLQEGGFPHRVTMDDPLGAKARWKSHKWSA